MVRETENNEIKDGNFGKGGKISDREKQLDIKDIETELEKRHGSNFPSNGEDYLISEGKYGRDKIMNCEYSAETGIYQSFLRHIKDGIAKHINNPQYFKKAYLDKIQKDLTEYKIAFATLKFIGDKFFPEDPQVFFLAKSKYYSINSISDKKFTDNINGEKNLTLDYGKNGQERIINETSINKLRLYEKRLSYLKNFIVDKIRVCNYTNFNQERIITNISIEDEEKRLSRIEEEEDGKNDVSQTFGKNHPVHFRELTRNLI